VPASIYGFCVTGSVFYFPGAVGSSLTSTTAKHCSGCCRRQKIEFRHDLCVVFVVLSDSTVHDGRMNGRSLVAYSTMVFGGVVLKSRLSVDD